MTRDLKAGKYKLPPAAVVNDADDTGGYSCFVVTLQDKDTRCISTVGTLIRVVSPDKNYTPEGQTLLQIIVRCHAVGVARLWAVKEMCGGDEFWIGCVCPTVIATTILTPQITPLSLEFVWTIPPCDPPIPTRPTASSTANCPLCPNRPP